MPRTPEDEQLRTNLRVPRLDDALEVPPVEDKSVKRKLTPELQQKMKAGRSRYVAKLQAMSPQERANYRMQKHLDKVIDEFLNACLGKGNFKGLDQKTQAALLVKALEWGIGRPNTGKPIKDDSKEDSEIGLVFE